MPGRAPDGAGCRREQPSEGSFLSGFSPGLDGGDDDVGGDGGEGGGGGGTGGGVEER